jgi:sulfofructose kinase
VRLPFRLPARESRAFDVTGFGLNSIDHMAVVAEFPRSNSKQRVQRLASLPGGQIATAMAACARLGWRAAYLGSFGGDDFGALSRQSLIDAGVDVSAARVVRGATNQRAVVIVDAATGDRTVLWDRDPALSTPPEQISASSASAGRLLIVDCHETAAATQAARYARAAGSITVVDVEKVRPGIGELLQQIDAIIAAEAFPSELTGYENTGRAIEAIAREYRAPVVAVTLGEEGSLARCGGREIRTKSFQVRCVDTTGAGDAFRGGFAAGCLHWPDGELEDVLAYANAVAALNCRALGARGGLPTPEEVEQLLIG